MASVMLLYPLADLLVVGVIGAAAAQHGWRPGSWSWLLLGLVAVAAWAPVPPRAGDVSPRHWVPINFSVLPLALLIVTASRPADYPLALVLAAGALATVLARFTLTLRANARMLLDAQHEAMVSARSYRAALGSEEALTELRRCAGAQFDAEAVELFVAAVRQWAATDRTGGSRVAASNHVAPASPVPNTSPDVAPK